jgi:single-stranded DNA-binding protein
VSFSLATTSNVKRTEWHNVCFYNNPILTKYCDDFVVKGCLVLVQGHVSYQKYEVNGITKQVTEIVPSSMCQTLSAFVSTHSLRVDFSCFFLRCVSFSAVR